MDNLPRKYPRHVAIIMDGNRRWAKARGLDEVEGHRAGVEVIKPLINRAFELGIEVITFWAFSTKNFERGNGFLSKIFGVFRETLERRDWFSEIQAIGGKIQIIGNPERFPADIKKRLNECLASQKVEKQRGIVNFALEYEGRDEIVRAMRKMAKNGVDMENVRVEKVGDYLDTAGLPDPDLMIRTGGEVRLSGYLLWQIADSELYFSDVLWPDFDEKQFDLALEEYARRERRFGK